MQLTGRRRLCARRGFALNSIDNCRVDNAVMVVPVEICAGAEMPVGKCRHWLSGLAAGIAMCMVAGLAAFPARAETLESALAQAYQNNPTINSQRAAVRATDEDVPQALPAIGRGSPSPPQGASIAAPHVQH